MNINMQTTVIVDAQDFVERLTLDDFCQLVEAAAEKFDNDYAGRTKVARAMAGNLSENGCRLLAEVVTHHFMRQAK